MTRKCKICRAVFAPVRPLQTVCGHDCAVKLVQHINERDLRDKRKRERQDDKITRDRLKSRSDWMREAQAAFNAYIRARDIGRPCISCGRHHQGQIHAGHYLSVGARPELRFEPLNVWNQCAPCNTYLSGNAVLYRQSLVREIGIELVEWLEGPHPVRKYTIDELKAIKKDYTERVKLLKASA